MQGDTSVRSVRIDRWLWAARFFKTRSLAKAAIEGGKVHMNGQRMKPAKEIQVGAMLNISRGSTEQTIRVEVLSDQRGPAKVAQTLYTETDESVEKRESARAMRAMERAGLKVPASKPSKKERRDLRKLKSLENNIE